MRKKHCVRTYECKQTVQLQIEEAEKATSERLQRIRDVEQSQTSFSNSKEPLCKRIGLAAPRHERGEWKKRLEECVSVEERDRNVEVDIQILRGNVCGDILMHVLHEEMRSVCFLLSSTFTDTEWERNMLLDDSVLYLQLYARKLGLDFRLVEMRWGIRDEASSSHQTSETCMAELERCQTESQGYSYVFLGAQKYGFRPFPATIPQHVFERLRAEMGDAEQALLDESFRLDTNVLAAHDSGAKAQLNEWHYGSPDSHAGPVYVLRRSKDFADWWPRFKKLQVKLREAALQVWKDKRHLLRDPRSQAYVKKFFISVTEEEFSRGMLWLSDEEQRCKTLVFKRRFLDLESYIADTKADKFLDVQGGAVDAEAQELLRQQLEMVPGHVETITYEALEWVPEKGLDPDCAAHAAYLRKLCDDFCEKMIEAITAASRKLAVKDDVVVGEATQHLRFALVRADKFRHTTSTRQVQESAMQYLQAPCHYTGSVCVLVVFGRSGAGKTYLLSKIMSEYLLSPDASSGVVMIRFLGTTPQSSQVGSLLVSLCQQLKRVYGRSQEVPSTFKELVYYFQRAVKEWPSEEKPLTLLLDSVDQLDDSNGGRRLAWLPVTGLPAHTKIVLSTLPDYPEFNCLSILRNKLGERAAGQLLEVPTMSEPEGVLMHLLARKGRTLTQAQREHVLEAVDRRADADAGGTPLWLAIVAHGVSEWASYDSIPFEIEPAVTGLIIALFERLQRDHGAALVRASLAYITLSKTGVSETELNHLLSLADEVLVDVYEWWVPPVRIIPPLLVTRLITTLAEYLTLRGDGSGAELVRWYHRQFEETSLRWLFGQTVDTDGACLVQEPALKQRRHNELADYFSGLWADRSKPYSPALEKHIACRQSPPGERAADRHVPRQPLMLAGDLFDSSSTVRVNTRRAHELVWHLTASMQVDRALAELTSPEYIAAKFALREGAELMREYAAAMDKFRDVSPADVGELAKCKATVGRFLKLLEQHPPLMVVQMCFQEPDKHPLCIAAKVLLGAQRFDEGKRGSHVVEWINKRQELDPCQLEIREHCGQVNALTLFCNDTRIASAGADSTIKITSAVSGEVVMELLGHKGQVTSVAATHDGKKVLSGGEDRTVRVWSGATGECEMVLRGHEGEVTSVGWSPDWKTIVSGSKDCTARVWDAGTGKQVCLLKGDKPIQSAGFSPDSKVIAAGEAPMLGAGNVRLHDALTGEVKSTMSGHTRLVSGVCFAPGGSILASCSLDETVRLWDVATGAPIGFPLRGHTSLVLGVCFAPEGNILASCSSDTSVRLWDVATGAPIGCLSCGLSVNDVRFGSNASKLAAACGDGQVRIFSSDTREELSPFKVGSIVRCLCYAPSGDVIAAGTHGAIHFLDPETGEKRASLLTDTPILCLRFSPDGNVLAAGDEKGSLRLYDVATGEPIGCHVSGGTPINCLGFSPDGKVIAAGDGAVFRGGRVRLYDVATGAPIACPLHVDSVVTQVELLDAATLATGSEDGKTRLWSVDGDKMEEKKMLTEAKISFSKSGAREQQLGVHVITAKGELVRVFRADDAGTKPVAFFRAPGPIQVLDCAGDKIAVGCKNGEVLHLRTAFLA